MMGKVWISGFLGAGKSSLVQHAEIGTDVEELNGLADPTAFAETGDRVITVVDAINIIACLADPVSGPLVRRQIETADLLVTTRTDVVEAKPALEALAGITDAPQIEAPFGDVPADTIAQVAPRPGQRGPQIELSDAFSEWAYTGPSVLDPKVAERFLEHRPKGIYRMSGVVRVPGGGLDLQVTGRTRQTTPVAEPEETVLRAIGPRDRFGRAEMDVAFADAVAASAQGLGMFSWR